MFPVLKEVCGILMFVWITGSMCQEEVLSSHQDQEIESEDPSTTFTPIETKNKEFIDLLNLILQRLGKCQLEAQLVNGVCSESIESIVSDLSPRKRRILGENLGKGLSKKSQLFTDPKHGDLKKPLVGKKMDLLRLSLDQISEMQDLLRHLLQANETPADASELNHLQNLIYSSEKRDLINDPIVQKTLNKFIQDINAQKRKYHFLD